MSKWTYFWAGWVCCAIYNIWLAPIVDRLWRKLNDWLDEKANIT